MKRTEAGKVTLALTGNSYPSKLQHFITSTVGFELTFHPRTHTVLGNFCDGLSLFCWWRSSPQTCHSSSPKVTKNIKQ